MSVQKVIVSPSQWQLETVGKRVLFFGGVHMVALLLTSNLLQSELLAYVVQHLAASAIGASLLISIPKGETDLSTKG
jgi:hypothetical protein